jgi:hypothetical protein
MARIAKRLAGPALLANAAATIYTVPANTKAIIKNIWVSNPTGVVHNFTISVGADAAATRIYSTYSIPAAAAGVTGSIVKDWVMIVMEAGEILQAYADAAATLVIMVDGEESILS